jgi:hypothetical protein
MNTIDILLNKISNAKELDFGDIISETIEVFKKVWLKGLITIVLIIIPVFLIGFLLGLLGLGTDPYLFDNGFDITAIASYYSSNVIYNIPQTIIGSTLTLAYVAAFYRICKSIITGENETDNFFYFFTKEHFVKVFILGIIYTAIATVAQLLFFVPYLYVFVPLSYFAVVLSQNTNLSEIEIIKVSFALGNKKWLLTFGTMLVAGILGMLGIIGCFVGLFLTISIVYLPSLLIYRSVIGFNETSPIDEIGANSDFN